MQQFIVIDKGSLDAADPANSLPRRAQRRTQVLYAPLHPMDRDHLLSITKREFSEHDNAPSTLQFKSIRGLIGSGLQPSLPPKERRREQGRRNRGNSSHHCEFLKVYRQSNWERSACNFSDACYKLSSRGRHAGL